MESGSSIKPKNRVMCNGCGKPKMLFEEKAKAERFLKFNAENILEETGKAPVRSYFCEFCGGWHITSNPSVEVGERIDKDEKKRFSQFFEAKNRAEAIKKKCSVTNEQLKNFDLDAAEDNLDMLDIYMDDLRVLRGSQNFMIRLMPRITKLRVRYELMTKAAKMTDEERMAYLAIEEPPKEDKKLISVIKHYYEIFGEDTSS